MSRPYNIEGLYNILGYGDDVYDIPNEFENNIIAKVDLENAFKQSALTDTQAQSLLLFEVEGYTLEEIAEITGRSPKAIHKSVKQAREKIVNVLDKWLELDRKLGDEAIMSVNKEVKKKPQKTKVDEIEDYLVAPHNVSEISENVYRVGDYNIQINPRTNPTVRYYITGDIYSLMAFIEAHYSIPYYIICKDCNIDYDKFKMCLLNKEDLTVEECQRVYDYVFNNYKGMFYRASDKYKNKNSQRDDHYLNHHRNKWILDNSDINCYTDKNREEWEM